MFSFMYMSYVELAVRPGQAYLFRLADFKWDS